MTFSFLIIRFGMIIDVLDHYDSHSTGVNMDFQTIFQNFLANLINFLPRLISGIVIFILTIVGSGFIAKWVKKVISQKITNKEMQRLIFMVTRWVLIILGTIFALDQVNFDVTSFIAGLGIAGFTIGFALQDIAKNFISGLFLLYRQPFVMGDYIKASDLEGIVKEINIRDTVIETLDGEIVIIPNNDVFEKPIVNFTHTRFRRKKVQIGLGYDQDTERAIEIFTEIIRSVPGVEADKGVTIRAEALGDSTLSLAALFWVDQQANTILDVHSEVVKAIKSAAEEHNINLPYPINTVLVKKIEE